ncbi:hypothetical protein EON81_26365 [bacterium]|nr:MAG: hypothetical protein EON81_26365 [bacterium]
MTIPLRHARLDVVRWTLERDARTHLAAHLPSAEPLHVGEWHTDDRVSTILARDLDGRPLWGALMAEGERDPWIVPTFGGLLLVSNEGLLLIDDRAQILANEGPFVDLRDVLIANRVVWVIGDYDAIRVTGTGCQNFTPGMGAWDGWRLDGDRLVAWMHEEAPEVLGDLLPLVSGPP